MNQADQQTADNDNIPSQEQGLQPSGDQHTTDSQQPPQGASPEDQQPDDGKPKQTQTELELQRERRRIDRLTRRRYEAEARMQQMQAENERLRAQLGQTNADDQPPSTEHPTHADLQKQAQEVLEQERFNARCNDLAAAAQAKFQDFGDKMLELSHELPLFDQQGKPAQIMHAILDADDPAAILYHLGSNPDEAAELAEMTPRQQMRRLLQIEDALGKQPPATTEEPAQPAATPTRTVSKAPAPAQPNRTASGQFTTADPSKQSDAEWYASRIKR